MTAAPQPGAGREELRAALIRACFDPGVDAGFRGERTTDQWRADAILAGPIAALIAERDALKAEVASTIRERDAALAVSEMNATSGGFFARHAETASARATEAETALAAERARAERAEGALRKAHYALMAADGFIAGAIEDGHLLSGHHTPPIVAAAFEETRAALTASHTPATGAPDVQP